MLCMFPAMDAGDAVSSRALYPRFCETTGRVSGVDLPFALDGADPWVKTCVVAHNPQTTSHLGICSPSPCSWRANSSVMAL